MGREFELKYGATAARQQSIAEHFGSFETISMETTYYDTPDQLLAARKLTLRRRLENGVSVCTLKTPGDSHGRGEWETKCDRIEDALYELCKLSQWEELPGLLAQGVTPICGARFTRRAKTIELPDCTVELALDAGVLLGGGREMPLCEVEVELKSGSEEAAAAFGAALAGEFGLVPEKKSKFRRALALAKGESHV